MDIRAEPGAGTHQRYHNRAQGGSVVPFFSYFESDLLPKLHCCQFSQTNCSDFWTLRNPTTCSGYKPPSPGMNCSMSQVRYAIHRLPCFISILVRHSGMVK